MGAGVRAVRNPSPCDTRLMTPRIFYQNKPERLASCPLTVHCLLHIADNIKSQGPIWAYWSFVMERHCSNMQRAIKSRRHPYASIANYIVDVAKLEQVKLLYDLSDELSFHGPRTQARRTEWQSDACDYTGLYRYSTLLTPA